MLFDVAIQEMWEYGPTGPFAMVKFKLVYGFLFASLSSTYFADLTTQSWRILMVKLEVNSGPE